MASLNLDDVEKKPRDFLDLSNVTINTPLELQKWLEKIPDLKIRVEKVRTEELSSDDVTQEEVVKTKMETYLDPVPATMSDVNLRELGRVDINWRMLTMSRPKTKIDEDLFSRLVQLEKLQYRTGQWEKEKEQSLRKDSRYSASPSHFKLLEVGVRARPQRSGLSKSGVTEIRLQTCKECGEEFCSGICKKYTYEDYSRTFNPVSTDIFIIHKPSFTPKLPKPVTEEPKEPIKETKIVATKKGILETQNKVPKPHKTKKKSSTSKSKKKPKE